MNYHIPKYNTMRISTKTVLIIILFIATKIIIASATDYDDYDDDEELNELITDIITFIVSGVLGACSESPECSVIMWPTIIIIGILTMCISCCCTNDEDCEYDHRPHRIRFRNVAASASGFTLGKYVMKY